MDCAFLLEIMAGKTRFDASELLQDKKGLQGTRIGWLGDWGGTIPFEDGVLSLCLQALNNMDQEGVTVDDLSTRPIFPLPDLWSSWNSIRFVLTASNFDHTFRSEMLSGNISPIKEELQWEISEGQRVTDDDLKKAREVQKMFTECLDAVFAKYDVLALPSAQVFPFPADWKWPTVIDEVNMDTYHRWMEVCVPGSFGGLPCSTVPAGFGRGHLPMGIQLLGKRGDDIELLRVANEYHRITNWPSREQPLKTSQKHSGV